jgi:hypothetical protein
MDKNWLRIGESRKSGLADEGERKYASDRLVKFLDISSLQINGQSFKEILRDKEAIKDFILSLDYPEYAKLVTGINAMVRNKRSDEEWRMDGKGVRMGDQNIFPEQEDKEELLQKSLEVAKIMQAEGRSVQDISILLSVALTGIHPFANGNGRTARVLLALLNAGYDADLMSDVINSRNFGNAVNASAFQDVAIELLEQTGLLAEEFTAWMEIPEHRKKIAETLIDEIYDNNNPQYCSGGISALDYFYKQLDISTDDNLRHRVFEG